MLTLAELKKNLKKVLNKYDSINDIIIFGSFVKGREVPKDIDIALIVKERDPNLISLVKEEIKISKVHLDFITLDDIFSKLFLSLINEGYSIKNDDFVKTKLNIKSMKLYSYDLKHLEKSGKTLFGIALKKTLEKIKGEKVSIGSVLIPMNQTSYFEDFLDAWGMKYKTREWTVI